MEQKPKLLGQGVSRRRSALLIEKKMLIIISIKISSVENYRQKSS